MRVRLFVQRPRVAGQVRGDWYFPGDVADLDDATALALIAAGSAERVDPPAPPAPAPSHLTLHQPEE